MRRWFLSLLLLPMSATAQATLDVSTPQLQMLSRVSAAVDRHVQKLGLNHDAVVYCRIELNAKTDGFPKNGSVPFGVNYNEIKSAAELDLIISQRESYEKTFMLSCLSRVKKELAGEESQRR